jgi:hypothetical protein
LWHSFRKWAKCISSSLSPRGSVASDVLFLREKQVCGFCLRGRDNNNHHYYYLKFTLTLYFYGPTALVGFGLHVIGVSLSHSDISHSLWILLTSDRPVAETATWQHTSITRDRHDPTGFETTIPASERLQNHALDIMAASFGSNTSIRVILLLIQITDENLQVLPVLPFFCPQKYDLFQIIFALKSFPTTTKHVEQTLFLSCG